MSLPLVTIVAIPAQGVAWPYVVDFIDERWKEVVLALIAFAGMLRLYAWTQLEEHNLFDMVMRGIPVEDLSSAGQLAWLASWLLGSIACILVAVKYASPLLPL